MPWAMLKVCLSCIRILLLQDTLTKHTSMSRPLLEGEPTSYTLYRFMYIFIERQVSVEYICMFASRLS